MTDRVGQQIDSYRLIRLLGKGGFADVYLGQHIRRQTYVAVKIMRERLANDNVKDFLNEARSFRLKHPHIIQLLDFGLADDIPFLVMEYAPHGSLRQRHPRGTQVPLGTIATYVQQVASALQYAHDEGLVHRDIKPDNMLLGEHDEILLSDFGIASIAHSTHSLSMKDAAGTIAYIAPEQLLGKPRPASDQYALGIVVYEWLCGERPFKGIFVEIHGQHLSASPPSLRDRLPNLSREVEEIVMTSLAKDPKHRFSTITAFAHALEQASQLEQARPSSPPREADASPPALRMGAVTVNLPPEQIVPDTPVSSISASLSEEHSWSEPTSPTDTYRDPAQSLTTFSTLASQVVGPLPSVAPAISGHIFTSQGANISPAPPNAPGAAGPNPLEPSRQGNSGEIPVVVPIPAAQPVAQPASRPSNQGSESTVVAGMVGAPAATGMPQGRTKTGSSIPPRHRRYKFLLIPSILLILLILGIGVVAAASGAFPSIAGPLPGATPSATVTITPKSADLKNTYIISTVTNTADPAQRQVQARQLSVNVSSQPKTVPATGKVTTKAVAATGTLTFYNGGGVEYDVAANTVFTDANGVQVATDTLAAIPVGSPATGYGRVTVAAHAVTLGTAGNIAALDFNTVNCCGSPSVFVSNTAPFTGGVDPQNYTAVQQSDVDNVANPQIKSLTDSVQTGLQKQLHPGEKLVSQPTCTSKVDATPAVGTKANTVTVTVTETCTAEAYDQRGALTMATTLLTDKAKTDPGPSYALMGKVVSTISSVTVADTKGTLSLQVTAEGIWVFQVSDALKQSWAKQIAGKSKQAATSFLAGQSGISEVDGIDLSGGNGNTLPTDPTQITIVVQTVPGLKGTPTSGPGTPGTSGSSTSQPGSGG